MAAGPYSGTAGSVVLISGGTTAIGYITEWSLDQQRTTVETTAFGDDNRRVVPAIKSATGSFTGSFDQTGQVNFINAFGSGTYLQLRLHFGSAGTTNYWAIASALITSMNTGISVTGKAEASYDFECNGGAVLT